MALWDFFNQVFHFVDVLRALFVMLNNNRMDFIKDSKF